MRKINLLGFPVGLLLVAVILVAELPIVAVAEDVPKTVKQLTWGSVTLDGVAAPIDTTVEVFIGTDTTPSGVRDVFEEGEYGAIVVTADESRLGEALTYEVDGILATKEGPDDGVFGYGNQVVNLVAVSDSSSTTWTFTGAGTFPRHLPDTFNGQVVLADLDQAIIPPEVQGVYWFDDVYFVYRFWGPGAPGTTLAELVGGSYADYVVTVTGDCDWDISLP